MAEVNIPIGVVLLIVLKLLHPEIGRQFAIVPGSGAGYDTARALLMAGGDVLFVGCLVLVFVFATLITPAAFRRAELPALSIARHPAARTLSPDLSAR